MLSWSFKGGLNSCDENSKICSHCSGVASRYFFGSIKLLCSYSTSSFVNVANFLPFFHTAYLLGLALDEYIPKPNSLLSIQVAFITVPSTFVCVP